VVAVLLGGCAGATAESADPSPAASSSPSATPTPAAVAPPSRNTMTGDQIFAIAGACGGLSVADPTVPGLALNDLSQWAADAMIFFASTGQCDEVPLIVERDAARTDPEGTVFASPLQILDAPTCPGGTVVSFWAHYDDDLIFANPALQEALDAGQCLRTFFFTISDAGEGESKYASNREVGIRAAYDVVRGQSGPWSDQSVLLKDGMTVTLTRPDGDDRVSLLFLRLPDGGLNASGYSRTGNESLPQLVTGDIETMHTLDTGQEVTLAGLESTVTEIVSGYRAGAVLAHLPGFAQGASGDHPDHRSVGRIVASQVDAGLIDPNTVQYAMGYPVAGLSPNIDPDPLARKLKAFGVYASHDPVINCNGPNSCLAVRRFGDWLKRQYLIPHNELVRVSD
jgi:hypothetical protein